jgi:hypothetical protein
MTCCWIEVIAVSRMKTGISRTVQGRRHRRRLTYLVHRLHRRQ